ncbi:MAG: hypothetical protein AABW59_02725 [archaeon]
MTFPQRHFFALALLILCLSFASAQPNEVRVGSYLLNVGNYDPSIGSYDISFYLWMKWDPTIEDFTAEGFEFTNGKEYTLTEIDKKPGYVFYRVDGSFFKSIDMTYFPFDSHEISFELEDQLLTNKDLVYVPDLEEKTSINPNISILGWKEKSTTSEISETYYDSWNETYSRYAHKIIVTRPLMDSIKVFLPIIFLSIIGFLTFLISPKLFSERISVSVFNFMAAVAYQIQVNVTIPPLGFFTLADKAMLALYTGIVLSTAYTIYIQWYEEKRNATIAKNVNTFAKLSYFAIQIVIFLGIVCLDLIF